ncbi:TPA: O-antigen polysaccharide polymerase Wzy [Bacillus cereus]|uniref:O-antigen polysaccharide polymerase Wzy n=1 Tax=Bacillus sp. FSL M8-0139 TaxID=2921613 RepID=UPI0030F92E65|nr:O-antigen polysaccharide polymerase Wzy [Bacillus cereus]
MLHILDWFLFLWISIFVSCRISFLVRKKKVFNMLDWAAIGVFLFYILPYFLGRFGMFDFKYNPNDDLILFKGILIILIFLLLTCIGYYSSERSIQLVCNNFSKVSINMRVIKIGILISVAIIMFLVIKMLAQIGLSNITNNYILRQQLSKFGFFVIFLQLPLGLSAYSWAKFIQRKSTKVLFLALTFTICAAVIAFIRGQRTDLILIFLIPLIALYAYRKSIKPLVIGVLFSMIFAIVYAINFKSSYLIGGVDSFKEGIFSFFRGDIDRNWTLWLAIENTGFASTEILPFYGSGYIYTLFAYIPRSIATFKGYSAESWFTFLLSSQVGDNAGVVDISQLSWGYAFGGIVEGIVNFGVVGVIFVGYFYGVLIRLLNEISKGGIHLYAVAAIICIDLAGYGAFTILVVQLPILITVMILNHKKKVYGVNILNEKGVSSYHG